MFKSGSIPWNKGKNLRKMAEQGLLDSKTLEKICKGAARGGRKKPKHSEETKKKISEARIKYIKENPDKVPYLINHYSKKKSYPEEYFQNIFNNTELEFHDEYHVGHYRLDFAFLEQKIDVEIDGSQHYYDKRIIASDKRRTVRLSQLGWSIIRVNWSKYQKLSLEDKKDYVDDLLDYVRHRDNKNRDRFIL